MSRPFNPWVFCRDVLARGATVEQDTRSSGRSYEAHSARLDANAREFVDELKPHLAAEAADRPERVEAAIAWILANWEHWQADAGQAAQQAQHPDAGTDAMREFLRPVLAGI